jgi:hypothetical protein
MKTTSIALEKNYLSTAIITLVILSTSCGQFKTAVGPAIDETGDEIATPVPNNSSTSNPGDTAQKQSLKITTDMNVRYLKSNVLEAITELPTGAIVSVGDNSQLFNYDYRNSEGGLTRSSTGFLSNIIIVSVPAAYASKFPASKIKSLNETEGGLHMSASIAGTATDTVSGADYSVITPTAAGAGFLALYNATGKPKFSYSKSIAKRFGTQMNKVIEMNSLALDTQKKYNAIYNELKLAVNRTVASKKSYMIMDVSAATQASINFEKTGAILKTGAWTIATQGTAVRHGFANVPCAETQSEILRQAYTRAGYKVTDDFNASKGNPLIWSNTAAVVNFSKALYTAGWIPWDSTIYKPLVGAFLMNGSGISPGHTYISAGDDGRIIVDNGAPQGRDLRKTSQSSINMQYQTGVFFLPPGIIPPKW